MTPTQRALAVCREQGWTAGIVEKWNPHARIRQDLFGCIDLIVADGHDGILGVQVTSGANVSARLAKAKAEARPGRGRSGRGGRRVVQLPDTRSAVHACQHQCQGS